ncbi:endonuclease III domain-containing protein [Bombilactobacillus bombi]|uniref:endonuclease III domain-containing protein n=1 Tax=Bombilactobacillus bombi TaxID=1303590 RepID=UPI0015E5FB84|nr:hypothetical protein [Bombilactobacillus bombi]MBA1434171.1 hypothetical protein [Bombilactobacillus bombi]
MSIFDPLNALMKVYQTEIAHWWQYPNPNRMLVEAILIQQTNSKNVMQAIANLKTQKIFDEPYSQTWERLRQMPPQELEQAIYPSGFYRLKTKRLLNFADWLAKYRDNLQIISNFTLSKLRQELNGINGVGPETADVMILYTFKHAVFIPDNYCLRLYQQIGLLPKQITYRQAQKIFENNPAMTTDYHMAQHWHAAIDEYGKNPQKLQNSPYKKIIPEK